MKAEDFRTICGSWFSPNIKYTGNGIAKFNTPVGIIEGKATVYFTETGEFKALLKVRKWQSNEPIEDIQHLLLGHKSDPTWFFNPKIHNECVSFEVITPNGTFKSLIEKPKVYIVSISDMIKIGFSFHRSQFVTASDATAKYWVIPLVNFVSEFEQIDSTLQTHPLYLFPSPNISTETGQSIEAHNHAKNQPIANKHISFQYNKEPAFIEPLPDFEKRKQNLISWKKHQSTTSIMVGSVGTDSIEINELEQWFPFDFLPLLEIACGFEVLMRWIEFRDSDGHLVKRIHISQGTPHFYRDREPLYKIVRQSDIGNLLTAFGALPNYKSKKLHGVLKQLCKVSFFNRNIEENLGFVCRGLDELIEIYGLTQTNLKDLLNNFEQTEIQAIIDEAAHKITAISKSNQSSNINPLAVIRDRILNSQLKDNVFALSLTKLLQHQDFQFSDVAIVEAFYQANPRPDAKTWSQLVSMYRNVTAHDNYFLPSENFDDVMRITIHLHDMLLRLMLKVIGYNSYYSHLVVRKGKISPKLLSVDWVHPNTPASELGYFI